MAVDTKTTEQELRKEIERLRAEVASLRAGKSKKAAGKTVEVPEPFKPIFDAAQQTVGDYFKSFQMNPSEGTIEVNNERYVLMRASALSYEFLKAIQQLYADRGEHEALVFGQNFLYDIAHLIGREDAANFHKKMHLTDPLEKLAAGPVHFAYSGWAFVEILPESRPSPDENYFIKYNHPFSFEADSWLKSGEKSSIPVCIMNSGYSSGWCEASFGIALTAVEVTCKARGDDNCTFIMAPPDKIQEYLSDASLVQGSEKITIPSFFERKKAEEQLKASVAEKEVLLKEIHHRVKNNLQIISSLLNIQSGSIESEELKDKFRASIDRIRSMALIHEMLYSSSDFSHIDMKGYLYGLADYMRSTYGVGEVGSNIRIELNVNCHELALDKAIPCGLVINEMVSNCFKYAFPKRDSGLIEITMTESGADDSLIRMLRVKDDGIGMPEGMTFDGEGSLGLQLIKTLVDQIDGEITVNSDHGAEFTVTF